MKIIKFVLCFVLVPIIPCSSQEILVPGEIIFHFINRGESTVTINASRVLNAKWWPSRFELAGQLILGNIFDNVEISVTGQGNPYTYFDTEGDDDEANVIALSVYEVNFQNFSTKFFINSVHIGNWLDIHLTFDYANDILYWGDCTTQPSTCTDIVEQNELINPFITQITNGLEEYWTHSLVLIPTIDNHPRLVWGPYPEQVDIAGYNIYRKVASGSYSLIHTNTDTEFDYVDTEFTMLRQDYVALSYYVINLKV